MTAPTTSAPPRRPGSARFLFGATMLVLEVFVVLFGALVAFGLRLVPTGPLVAGSLGLAALMVVATALLRRGSVGWVLGSVAQVLLLATALVLPAMVVPALVFGALWIASFVVGGRIDVERQERYAEELRLHREARP